MSTKKHRVTISLGQQDDKKLQKFSELGRMTKSQVVAYMVTHWNDRPRKQSSDQLKKVLEELMNVDHQLSKAGNNINQIAFVLNASKKHGAISNEVVQGAQIDFDPFRLQTQVKEAIEKVTRIVSD